jgi:hypothetical protein
MKHLNRKGDLAEFLTEARAMSRTNDHPEFTAAAFNTWARAQFAIPEP